MGICVYKCLRCTTPRPSRTPQIMPRSGSHRRKPTRPPAVPGKGARGPLRGTAGGRVRFTPTAVRHNLWSAAGAWHMYVYGDERHTHAGVGVNDWGRLQSVGLMGICYKRRKVIMTRLNLPSPSVISSGLCTGITSQSSRYSALVFP